MRLRFGNFRTALVDATEFGQLQHYLHVQSVEPVNSHLPTLPGHEHDVAGLVRAGFCIDTDIIKEARENDVAVFAGDAVLAVLAYYIHYAIGGGYAMGTCALNNYSSGGRSLADSLVSVQLPEWGCVP